MVHPVTVGFTPRKSWWCRVRAPKMALGSISSGTSALPKILTGLYQLLIECWNGEREGDRRRQGFFFNAFSFDNAASKRPNLHLIINIMMNFVGIFPTALSPPPSIRSSTKSIIGLQKFKKPSSPYDVSSNLFHALSIRLNRNQLRIFNQLSTSSHCCQSLVMWKQTHLLSMEKKAFWYFWK